MLQEILAIGVGTAVAKAILKTWLKDTHVASDLSGSLVDILAKLTIEFAAKRRLEREFHEIADKVADNLAPFFATEGGKLDDGEKNAVALALGEAMDKIDVSPIVLVADFDLRSDKLARALIENGAADTHVLSQAGEQLYCMAAYEIARYVVESSARLPSFSPAVFGQVLSRERTIIILVEEVLSELRKVRELTRAINPEEEIASFEAKYRVAISHRFDEVELFGLEAPSKIRRQNLTVAYVTLSMARKGKPAFAATDAALFLSTSKQHAIPTEAENAVELVRQRWYYYKTSSRLEGAYIYRHRGSYAFFYKTSTGSDTVDAVLASSSRMLIRGEAGSGKTTLLQWLTVSAASQRLKSDLESWNSAVPFLIKLRDYAEKPLPTPDEFVRGVVPSIADVMPQAWAHSRP